MLKELINVKIIGTLYMNKSIVTEILLQFRRLQKFLFFSSAIIVGHIIKLYTLLLSIIEL